MKNQIQFKNLVPFVTATFVMVAFIFVVFLKAHSQSNPPKNSKNQVKSSGGGSAAYLIIERKWNGNWYPVTGQNKVVWVSQRIYLKARMSDGSKLSNQSWQVPGDAFYSYTQTSESTQVESLTPSLLKGNEVSFIWRDRGESLKVNFSGVAKGRPVGPKGVTFQVKKPRFRMDRKIDGVNWSARPETPSDFWLRLGDYSLISSDMDLQAISVPPRGIVIGANKDGEWPTGGLLRFVQVATLLDRKLYDSSLEHGRRLGITSGLDSDAPNVHYPNTVIDDFDFAMEDSPGQAPAFDAQRITCADEYSTWLMFKTNNQNSQWVPLRKLTWKWSGQMDKNSNGSWNVKPTKQNSDSDSSSETTELPKWTNNRKPFFWVSF